MRHLVAVAAALACACSPGVFEDLGGETTMDSNGPGDQVGSAEFPTAITGVPGIPGMRFVAAGNNPISLSTYVYTPEDGELVIDGIDAPGITGPDGDLDDPPELVAFSGDDDTRGLVFLGGLDEVNRILVFTAGNVNERITLVDEITVDDCPGVSDLGEQMVFANTNLGDEELPDLIFTGNRVDDNDRLLVIEDYQPGQSFSCSQCDMINQEGGHELRVNDLAAIDIEGEDFDQIVMTVSDNRSGGPDLINGFQVFNGADIAGTPCFLSANELTIDVNNAAHNSKTTDPAFGRFIVVGDFDGNDADDLAFTNPEAEMIRFHLNPAPGDAGAPMMIPTPPGQFEPIIASGDVDNDDRDELLIANPAAAVDGVDEAGTVTIVDPVGGMPRLIHDSQPESRQRFGLALTVGSFQRMGENVDVMIAGAFDEVFTVFAATPEAFDPRFEPPAP